MKKIYIKGWGPIGPTIKKHLGKINGEYVKKYEPEAFDGYGDVVFTDRKEEALTFETFTDAYLFVGQIPNNRPVRDDGQPNRPISAFTLEVKAE